MTIKMPMARFGTPKPANDEQANAFIAGGSPAPAAAEPVAAEPEPIADKRQVVNSRWDAELLRQIDRAARKQGISRTAWLHVAAAEKLER